MNTENYIYILVSWVIIYLFGCLQGRQDERRAWLTRANTREDMNKSAHYAYGKFYYIFEESAFLDELKRRERLRNGTQSSTS